MPSITRTPGDFQGAQFEFEELLQIVAENEVNNYNNAYVCIYSLHVSRADSRSL